MRSYFIQKRPHTATTTLSVYDPTPAGKRYSLAVWVWCGCSPSSPQVCVGIVLWVWVGLGRGSHSKYLGHTQPGLFPKPHFSMGEMSGLEVLPVLQSIKSVYRPTSDVCAHYTLLLFFFITEHINPNALHLSLPY